MKTTLTIALLTSSLSMAGGPDMSGLDDLKYLATSASPFIITSAPSFTIAEISQNNEILMVSNDAVIALETGFISNDLASVIEKLKASEVQFAAASDDDIVAFIADLQQSSR
jgi:hypothetical protein